MTQIIFIAAFLLSVIVPFGAFLLGEKKKGNLKAALGFNVFFFFGTLVIANVLLFSGKVSAAEASTVASNGSAGLQYIAAALSTGLAALGAGIAVSGAASAAIGAVSEDASIMGKSLVFVALAEGIALYGLLITFLILAK
ncbi:ATP synthase subunit C [Anaeromicropila herbilytica]|uniref:ATP synthase F(0) sector subunit c n=1 Tax=Anaeromicropila herbilytica TaxID=2785025 RepID=A0A7R7IES7_9FIRM|nr:ATP synthase subunit C [Anaeromicropila herbilytica]BCN33003.1 ATPase [Anaeromicropila herbilytica]